jgi:outer membrane protein OmpA-like peptidoglycan-associated protein
MGVITVPHSVEARLMRTPVRMIACVVIGALLAGCETFPGETNDPNHAQQDALIGAGLGVVAGLLTGSDAVERRQHALIGAGIGALAGAGIGAYQNRQEAELRKRMADTGVDVVRQGDNIVLSVPGNVTFASGSADLAPDFYPVLDNIASTLGEYRQTMVEVAGHTDDVGDDQSNQVLSERRAAAVASYLESRGVMQERIMIVGAGEAHPIANNDTEAGRAENRRVEITIVPVKA